MRIPRQYPRLLLAGGISAALAATLAGAPALAAQPGTTPGELDVDLVPVAVTGEVVLSDFDGYNGDAGATHTEASILLDDGRLFLVDADVSDDSDLAAGGEIEATLLVPADVAATLPAADLADLEELVAEAAPAPGTEAGIEALPADEPAVAALLDAAAAEGGEFALSRDYNVVVQPYSAPTASDFNRIFDVAVISPDGAWNVTDAQIRTVIEKAENDWSNQTGKSFNWTVSEIKWLTAPSYSAANYESLFNQAAVAYGHSAYSWYSTSNTGRQLFVILPRDKFTTNPTWGGVSMFRGTGVGSGGMVGYSTTKTAIDSITSNGTYAAAYLTTPVHELGHVHGLGHATKRICSNAPSTETWNEASLGTCTIPTGNSATTDYEDGYSVMGDGKIINPTMRYELNLLDDAQVTVIDSNVTSQQVTLKSPTGTTGVELLVVAGTGVDYTFEYRSIASTDNVSYQTGGDGVRAIRLYDTNKTYFHEAVPNGTSKLPVGSTFISADGRLRVTLSSQDTSKAVLSVTNTGVLVDDCGNTTSDACSWTLNSTGTTAITKGLQTAADQDLFRFTAPVSGSWSFQSSAITSGSDVYGYLLSSNGTTVLAEDDDTGGSLNFKITQTLTAGTTYYLRIKNWSATTSTTASTYTITATAPTTTNTCVVPTPTISGTKIAGYTVSAVVGATTPSTATKTFQWYRGSTAISGATSSQYALTAADGGQSVKVRVTCTASGYTSSYAESAAESIAAATLSVTPTSYTFASAAAATSSAFTVTTNQASWSLADNATWLSQTKGTTTFTATATANTTTASRAGTITVSAGVATPVTVAITQPGTVTDDCGSSTSSYCTWTLSSTAASTITKRLEVAADEDWIRFTAPIAGSWTFAASGTPSGSDTYGYLLNSSGSQLAYDDDSNGSYNFKITYTLTANTVYFLRVRNYSSTTSTTADPYTITATPPVRTVVVPTPTISGTTTVGWTLTASVGTLTPSTATKSYQWYRGSTAISGATGTTYALTAADAGQAIKVRVTGTASGYTSSYSESPAYTITAAALSVTPTSASLPYTASTTSAFTVTTNQPSWSLADNATWLSQTKLTTTFTATATANTSTTARTGTITISAGLAPSVTVTVTQGGRVTDDCGSSTSSYCAWTLSATAASTITKRLEVAADEDWIRFTAPIAGSWTFAASGTPSGSDTYGYLLNSSGTQLAYDDDSNGSYNFKITYTLTANTVYFLRVRNYSSTTSTTADPYTITATPPAGTLSVTPTMYTFASSAAATSSNFTVTTNQSSWSVTDNATWLTITKYSTYFTVRATANTGTSPRTATVTVSAGTATPVTVTVVQPGVDDCGSSGVAYCSWTLSSYASSSITKKLEVATDEDWIRFTAPIAGSWTFKSSGIPTGSDIYGYLLNSSGSQLAYDDDGAGNRNFSITYTLTANTVYYLRVKNYSPTTSTPANPYTITATLPGDECGQNLEDYCSWSLGTAGGTISKGLQYRGDEDYIRFTAPSSGSWTFTSSGIPTGSDIYGHLLNASGTQLAYNDDGAGNRNFKITYTLTSGTVYYLRVRNFSTSTTVPANPYTITATKG